MELMCECNHYQTTHEQGAFHCRANGCRCENFKAKKLVDVSLAPNAFRAGLPPFVSNVVFAGEEPGEVTTWVVDLQVLHMHEAKFSHPNHGTKLTLARDEWEKLGRPVTLYVAPTGVNPLD